MGYWTISPRVGSCVLVVDVPAKSKDSPEGLLGADCIMNEVHKRVYLNVCLSDFIG